MCTRSTLPIAFLLALLVPMAAHARFVVLDASFDARAAGTQLDRRGALFGEPVAGPNDSPSELVVVESVGDMAVLFPDVRVLGRSELSWTLRDGTVVDDGLLTVSWTLAPQSLDEYYVSLRGPDFSEGRYFTLRLTASGATAWRDGDTDGPVFDTYTAGVTRSFRVVVDFDAGTYGFFVDGSQILFDEPHGVTDAPFGSLLFGHPDDGNGLGSFLLDDVEIDWRPGTAPRLLAADFDDKPAGEVIQARGAFFNEPAQLNSGALPIVVAGPPNGSRALVFEDLNAGASSASFEFFGSVEPTDQPVAISFTIEPESLDDYQIGVREQGGNAEDFLTIRLLSTGSVDFLDQASGTTAYHTASYVAGQPIRIELHFEPSLDRCSVWWNGNRIVHRRAHGIVGREVGRINFGHASDVDLTGVLRVDRIVAHTLGLAVGVADTPIAGRTGHFTVAPNPFNPSTEIRFELTRGADVELDVFDARGRHVLRLLEASLPIGFHRAPWHGVDSEGRDLASGVYRARLRVDGESRTRTLTLVK